MKNIVIYRGCLSDVDYAFYRTLDNLSPYFKSYMKVDCKRRLIDLFDIRIWFCHTDVHHMSGVLYDYYNAPYDNYAKLYLGRNGAKEFEIDDIIDVLIEMCLSRQQSEFPADAGHERREE